MKKLNWLNATVVKAVPAEYLICDSNIIFIGYPQNVGLILKVVKVIVEEERVAFPECAKVKDLQLNNKMQ